MPTLDRMDTGGAVVIRGFSGSGFRIGNGISAGAALVWGEGGEPWQPPAVADLSSADFALIMPVTPPIELLLIGTGARLVRPPRALVDALAERRIAVEAMDSRAAARTYNLLVGEGRRVAVALYPLDV